MPLKKRTNLPSLKATKASFLPSAKPSLPGKPLSELVKEYDNLASDAAWNGQLELAEDYQKLADSYRKRLLDGELWEIDH